MYGCSQIPSTRPQHCPKKPWCTIVFIRIKPHHTYVLTIPFCMYLYLCVYRRIITIKYVRGSHGRRTCVHAHALIRACTHEHGWNARRPRSPQHRTAHRLRERSSDWSSVGSSQTRSRRLGFSCARKNSSYSAAPPDLRRTSTTSSSGVSS